MLKTIIMINVFSFIFVGNMVSNMINILRTRYLTSIANFAVPTNTIKTTKSFKKIDLLHNIYKVPEKLENV